MISLTICIEPVAWARVKRSSTGHAYVPGTTRRFKRDVARLMYVAWRQRPLESPLRLTLRFYLPRPKKPKHPFPAVRPDLDNFTKAVLDAGNGVIWKDDGLICELLATKIYALQGTSPRIDLGIEHL